MTKDLKLQEALEKYFLKSHTQARIRDLLQGLFTDKERKEFALRLEIIKRLKKGVTHQKIAKSLGVGVATVTRGAKEIKNGHFKYLP